MSNYSRLGWLKHKVAREHKERFGATMLSSHGAETHTRELYEGAATAAAHGDTMLSEHYGPTVSSGVRMTREGYTPGVFVAHGKNYKMVEEPYGSFSIKAAVRGPYMAPAPAGSSPCGNCGYAGPCRCPGRR